MYMCGQDLSRLDTPPFDATNWFEHYFMCVGVVCEKERNCQSLLIVRIVINDPDDFLEVTVVG